MLDALTRWLDDNKKEVKRLQKTVDAVNELEEWARGLEDGELAGQTGVFRQRLEQGETLESLLPEAFAVVREASRRTLGMRHFDVQIMGGMGLHQGRIAEMKTGEGKTLAATMPAYLNALEGRGVHIVTVNDYLARRDSQWMGTIYRFLGLDVGLIVHGLDNESRKAAYRADITYGTNNEFGFDFLRDNMVLYAHQRVQRPLWYAIIDEVDSILIDEARTPLIISGSGDASTEIYDRFARIVPHLKPEVHYTVDEKAHTAAPTEEGIAEVEQRLGVENLYDDQHMDLSHYLYQALKARVLMHRDRDYVVQDGQVIIVDEFTGRLMHGRRYSDGLHQAIEAKEGLQVQRESLTLASITFQNYFRMYHKLAGMTGTAKTEEDEFRKIYNMDVVVIPTNEPMIRQDRSDLIYKNEEGKFRAVVEEIEDCHRRGQPVLVGTISIEKSERLSAMLKRRGVPHNVLNAKHHAQEAEIVAQAGRLHMVTIATNMAGRGTDIVLGGNPEYMARRDLAAEEAELDPGEYGRRLAARRREHQQVTDEEHRRVVELGGLHITGTERHEARRIDNQLRGRSGRQGDPGSSRFFLSLEDDLMRLFGSENMEGVMERFGMEEDQPIEARLVTRLIENAQRKVEARNFDIRRMLLQYDDVMNQQREVIYQQRRQVLEGEDLKETILGMADSIIAQQVDTFCPEEFVPEEWDREGLVEALEREFLPGGYLKAGELEGREREELRERVAEAARAAYRDRETEIGADNMRELERVILLRVVDRKWMEHLDAMDYVRQGIGLRAYGQRDPLTEYKYEAYQMFQGLVARIQEDVVRYAYRVTVSEGQEAPQRRRVGASPVGVKAGASAFGSRGEAPAAGAPAPGGQGAEPARSGPKVGRNDPCPCGSGKKYKKCCGAAAASSESA